MNLALAAQGVFGMLVFLTVAWLISEDRFGVRPRVVLSGLALQITLALLLLNVPPVREAFSYLTDAVQALQDATEEGTKIVFGFLGGDALPFEISGPGSAYVLAFRALPLIIVISALSALLWHYRILALIVRGFSWVMRRTYRIGGAVGTSAAANIFIGMIEAPILIRPYLGKLSRSELFVVMSVGMSTIAGTMMVLYATVLSDFVPNAFSHLLTASIINAPAAIMVALIMVPQKDDVDSTDKVEVEDDTYLNGLDAIAQGTTQGVNILINVIALIIVFVALIALSNMVLGLFPDVFGEPLTLQRLFGFVLAPWAWLMGIEWKEAQLAGSLLGTKVILNELIAYLNLAGYSAAEMSARTSLILTYALCSFGNLTGLSIMIAGLIRMVPERRREIIGLGFKSVFAGLITTSLTGALIGVLAA